MRDLLRRALGEVPQDDHVGDAALAAYLDGSLCGEDRDSVERHLGRCPRCAQELAVATRVEMEAEALREPVRSPTHPPRELASRGSSTRTWLRLAASIVLVFGALVLARYASVLIAGRLEPVLLAQIETWAHRDVSADGTSLVVSGGPGIELAALAIGDDPRFSDGEFLSADRVSLHVHPSTLLGGRLTGSVEIDRPVLRLVRNRDGQWNVETLGGGKPGERSVRSVVRAEIDQALDEAARGLPPAGATEEPRVQLTSATIENGILEIAEMDAGGRSLKVENVDLSYHGVPGRRASLSLRGHVGSEQDRIALRGEVGPFERDAVPVYRFREVELEAIPITDIPGAPSAVLGRLTFDGHLMSAGRALDDIVAAARGAGEMTLCCGAFRGRNLARELVEHLAALPGGEAVLQAAREGAALGSALDAPETRYDHLGGIADLEPGTLHLAGLEIDSTLFRADGDASIGLEGHLTADGSIELAPELAAVVLASAPLLAELADPDGTLHLPFRASGTWADLRLELELDEVFARLEGPEPPGLLAMFSRGLRGRGLFEAFATRAG